MGREGLWEQVVAELRLPFRGQGLCAQTDPELFYPEPGGTADSTAAKRVCARCEVRFECLEYALVRDERFGIWGGLSERERRELKRQRRVVA